MRRLVYRLAVAASLLAIAYGGLSLLRWLHGGVGRPPLSIGEAVIFVGVLVGVVHLILAIHEVGHIAGGWIAGLRFRILIVGLLRIAREDGRVRFGLNRDLAHYGGLAGSSPAGGDATAGQLAIVTLAGPVSNILFGSLAVIATLAGVADELAVTAHFARFVAGRSLAVFGAGSIAAGLANLVPMRMGANRSDGARLVALWREGATELS